MQIDKTEALRQIDEILEQFHKTHDPTRGSSDRSYHRMKSAISRLAPSDSPYHKYGGLSSGLPDLIQALRDDYATGCLENYREIINRELLGDIIGLAKHFLEEGLRLPAAILAGSVLEEHLHKLCDKHGVPLTSADGKPIKADTLNADLKKKNAYGSNDQKQVTAWLGIRNSAAHAKPDEFTEGQVTNMIDGLRVFIAAYPA